MVLEFCIDLSFSPSTSFLFVTKVLELCYFFLKGISWIFYCFSWNIVFVYCCAIVRWPNNHLISLAFLNHFLRIVQEDPFNTVHTQLRKRVSMKRLYRKERLYETHKLRALKQQQWWVEILEGRKTCECDFA